MKTIIITILVLLPFLLMAQPGGGLPGGDPDKVPITGIEWLLIAGGVLGSRKIFLISKNRRK